MSAPDVVFVTGNANKLKEVKMILASESSKINLINEPLDLEEIQDVDLQSIALAKCKQASKLLGPGRPVFVEDTALCFDSFNGLPGAYIKWFVKSMGLAGIVQMLSGFENKGAEAITTLTYTDGEGHFHTFQGVTHGTIVTSRGPTDFGWDSIFQPDESHGQTYAEMDKGAKNAISHRGRAFAEFKAFIATEFK